MDNDLSAADNGRSSRRDRIMGKLFKSKDSKDKKQTSEESANEISDFLGTSDRLQSITNPPPRPPPFMNAGPPALALDTSTASRFTKAAMNANTSQQALPSRTRSGSPPRPQHAQKHKGLAVRFADTYPEVIGEGGDECETAVAEIGRRKRAKSAPPPPPSRQGQQNARQPGANGDDDDFVPAPIRRTQTGFSTIGDQERIAPTFAISRSPPDPPKSKSLPAGDPVPSRFLDVGLSKDENRRSFIDTQQQEHRRAEGMALAQAMRAANGKSDSDDHASSPESTRGASPPHRQPQPASIPSLRKESPAASTSEKPSRPPMPPPSRESTSSVLRSRSEKSPLSPQDSAARVLPPLPFERSDANGNSNEPTRSDTLSSSYPSVGYSTTDPFSKSAPAENPPSRANTMDRSKSVRDVGGDEALETFTVRTKHLYELFRLYTEQQKPLDTARPENVVRAAVWWFLKGRTALENAIRNRTNDPTDTRALIARYQAYTDLAKAYWLTEVALPEIAVGKFNPTSGELGEVRQVLTSNLRKLSLSMKRNEFLPPDDPFLPQTMDKSIWVDYPSLSQDIVALLNGVWGSALTAVSQSTRSMEALDALPIGDTSKYFIYTRVPVETFLMEQGMESGEMRFPCMLSVVRSPEEPDLNFVVASQNGTISLRIQSGKKTGPTWQNVKWRPEGFSIEIKLPRGFVLAIRCAQHDFKTLWGIFDFSNRVQGYLYPRQDEVKACSMNLKAFHYFDSNAQGRAFPKDAVAQCQVALYERVFKENSPTGPRTFHRGFRLAVVTGPRIRTLSGVSHTYSPQLPVHFAMLRGDQRLPALQLGFNDGKDRGHMVMSFTDEHDREKLLRLLCGSYVHADEEIVAEVPLEGMNISEGLADIKGGFAATQQLPWQRARIVNDRYVGDIPQTVLAEKLRIEIESVDKTGVGIVSTITDRVNVAPGELKLRLGTKDILTFQILRQPQLDMTVSLLESSVPKETARDFATLRDSIHDRSTIRTYRFQSFKDLHAFQYGLTGFNVLFDGIAASLNISRRMMVVPIHKKWEAGTTRIQIVQQEKTVHLLAFFEDWHHGQCMGFALKGTDVFECFSRNGKAGLKLADAKFPLPKVPTDGAPKTDDMAFLCLDMPDFAGEHDDINILFDDTLERDRLCSVLPAPVKGSRISKAK